MMIFARLIAAAVTVLLAVFSVRCQSLGTFSGKQWLLPLGLWAALCAVSAAVPLVPVTAAVSALTAGVICRRAGQMTWKQTVFFGIGFGLLRLAASGTALLCTHYLVSANPQCALLLEMLVLYAIVVFTSVFSEQCSRVPAPFLQLIPIWLIAGVLCFEVIRNGAKQDAVILEAIAFLWLLYAGIHLLYTGNQVAAKLRKFLTDQEKNRHYVLREEYYQQLLEKQTETRALWHDLNKYLRAAKAETASAQALAQLEAMLDSATEMIDTGNQVLNVILNEYAQSAKAAGTELRLTVQVPQTLTVSAADLYVLIGNTMDNALEACQRLPLGQRLIDMKLRIHNDMLYYKLVNPYDTSPSGRTPEPMRGHGLTNVRRCVESYGGSLDILKENGFFTVMAHLNLEP